MFGSRLAGMPSSFWDWYGALALNGDDEDDEEYIPDEDMEEAEYQEEVSVEEDYSADDDDDGDDDDDDFDPVPFL